MSDPRRFGSRDEYEAWKLERSLPTSDPARDGLAPAMPGAHAGTPREFRVEVVAEGALGTLLLGASKLPVRKMEEVLNGYGAEGWDLAFMVIERKRYMLFWKREAAVITFSRELVG